MNYEFETFEEYQKKYSPRVNPDKAHRAIAYYYIFDGLGMLVRNNVIDIDTVYRMLGRRIINIWFMIETTIEGVRKQLDPGPDYLEDFEYLALELVRMRKEKGISLPVGYLKPNSKLHNII